MKAKDNQVYRIVAQFCKSFPLMTPDMVIFGYARLLCMPEDQVKIFIPGESMEDLEGAHEWFSENKLSTDLIKSGFMLVVQLIPDDISEAKADKWTAFIGAECDKTDSRAILDKALELSFVAFKGAFAAGREIASVFEYQAELKEKFPINKSVNSPNGNKSKTDANIKAGSDAQEVEYKESLEHSSLKKNQKDQSKLGLGNLSSRCRDLNIELLDVVKGQNQAIQKFIQGYCQGELLGQSDKPNQPKAYFFFFGPPGVGKTLLAETVAKSLGIPSKKFDMSEYAGHQAHEDLLGIASFYTSSNEGTLVSFVRQNPRCLLIFDEIEKAHKNVIRLFLQILGSGRVQNMHSGKEVSFTDSIIIFTSNVGKDLYEDRSVNLTLLPERVIVGSIRSEKDAVGNPVLPLELCSRIASGNIVMFNHMSVQYLTEIVRENFDNIVKGMKSKYGIDLTYADELPLLFLYNMGGGLDARVASGQSSSFIKDEIYELIRQLESSSTDGDCIKKIHLDIDWKNMDAELKRLFRNDKKSEVLIFSDNSKFTAGIPDSKYVIHRTANLNEANELMKKDIEAVFIDPFFGHSIADDSILSMADYNTDGVSFFHGLMEKKSGIPVYMLEMDREFSGVDKDTFIQEGAFGIVGVDTRQAKSFSRQICQIMEELYMEKESLTFSQRGWVIDFNTRQLVSEKDAKAKIQFYNLRKRMAIDVESGEFILSYAERPTDRFGDVIGAEKAKEELQYFVQYLRNPRQFIANNAVPPKGILLYGPPGTGKTMLARAMAGESDVAFLQTSASEFMNKYIGESEANIKRLFK